MLDQPRYALVDFRSRGLVTTGYALDIGRILEGSETALTHRNHNGLNGGLGCGTWFVEVAVKGVDGPLFPFA